MLAFVCIVSAQTQSWCGIQQLYFQHNATTTPIGYEELINHPSGNAEVIENVSVINTGGPVLIDNYISPVGSFSGTNKLDAGLRRYRVYAYVSSNVGTTQLNFTKFVRHADGSETNIYTALSGDINDLTVTEHDFNHVMTADLPLNSTDRLGIRVSANTTHSSTITVSWVYQGETHTSMLDSGYFECSANPFASTAGGSNLVPNELPLTDGIAVVGCFIAVAIISFRKR